MIRMLDDAARLWANFKEDVAHWWNLRRTRTYLEDLLKSRNAALDDLDRADRSLHWHNREIERVQKRLTLLIKRQ